MTQIELAIVVDGVDLADDDVVDRLYGAMADVTVAMRDGAQIIYVDRDADSVAAALLAVERELQEVLPSAFVVGLENQCLVSSSGAARLAGRTRQSVQQHVSGQRGSGFVPALLWVDATRPAWPASEVAAWSGEVDEMVHQFEQAVGAIMIARSALSGGEIADAIDLAVQQGCRQHPGDAHAVAVRLRSLADRIEQPA